MIKWFIDKTNKVPLYLQLKDLIKYYISTGAIQDKQQLPTVNELAQELEVNFETIRKAYKELEKDGLIWTKRGKGTFVDGHISSRPAARPTLEVELGLMAAAKSLVRQFLQSGKGADEIRSTVDNAISEVASERTRQLVIFSECNLLQIKEISQLLASCLNLPVEPVLVQDLREKVEELNEGDQKLTVVVTTGFHVNEVRKALVNMPVKIDFLVTNMSPETRRELDEFDKSARYGFICRDQESISFYKDLLRAELGIKSEVSCCILGDEAEIKSMFQRVDVLLVSPPVYGDIKRRAPKDFPIFNVFDRVDPMSLKVLKERVLSA